MTDLCFIKHEDECSTIPSVCPSIFQKIEQIKKQVCYAEFTDPFYLELCLIIAEIYVIKPNGIIKIGGSEIEVRVVQEVYGQLTYEHVKLVYTNFHDVTSRIYNKKAYLRTALYNAVFEIDSHYTNLFKHDMSV